MTDRKFEIQRIAPTANGGREHAFFRSALPDHVGVVAIETALGSKIGTAVVGEAPHQATLIVMSDGLSASGCETFTPSLMVIPEERGGQRLDQQLSS